MGQISPREPAGNLEIRKPDVGKKAAKDMWLRIKETEELLSANPLMGKTEPELKGKELQFRSFVIHKHYKPIYYYMSDEDVLRVVDLWDTRMNPATLVKKTP